MSKSIWTLTLERFSLESRKTKQNRATKPTKLAAAIGLIILGTHSAFAQIVVNGSTTHAVAGVTENTGSTAYTSAVKISNNGNFIADGGLTLSTQGQSSNGLYIDATGGAATLTAGNLVINTGGYDAHGILALNGIATVNHGNITTQGYLAHGIKTSGTGALTGDNLNIETHGYQAYGAYILSSGATPSKQTLSNTTMTTFGDVASAIQVENGGIADIDNIAITTHGFGANGAYAKGSGSLADLNNGSISTSGGYSHTLHASTDGKVVASGLDVSTTGDVAFGSYTEQGGHAIFSGGKIKTTGVNSDGVRVASAGSSFSIDHSTVETQGLLSAGVRIKDTTASVQDSKITTHGDGAYGLDAFNSGSIINANNLSINTFGAMEPTGNTASAVVAEFGGVVNLTGVSSVQTSGNHAIGLLAQVRGLGINDSVINAGDGVNTLLISTSGKNGFGVEACSLHGDGLDCSNSLQDFTGTGDIDPSSQSIVNIVKAIISTSGQDAYGLYSISQQGKIVGSDLNVVTSGGSAHAITLLRGGQVTLTDSQIQAQGSQADGARISGGVINGSTALLTLNNTVLKSDTAKGIYVEPGDSIISLNHSQLVGREAALLTSTAGNTSFSAVNGSAIQGAIDASSNLNAQLDNSQLSGDVIFTPAASTDALTFTATNNSVVTGGMTNVTSANLSNSQWNMTKSSTITGLTNGLQINNGQVHFVRDGVNYKTLTTGSLSGNGQFIVNTELNDGGTNTHSDLLHVTGNASGSYQLLVNNTVGTGAKTVNDGIKVAQLDGDTTGTSVTLANPVTAGAYEYLLYQGGADDRDDWYLRSQAASDSSPSPVSYNPSVPGYVVGSYISRMYGFDTVGTLHERVGDQENLRKNAEFNQGAWGRISGGRVKSGSGRFNYDAETWFAQFGGDLYQAYSESGARTHAGVTATVGQVTTNAQDGSRSRYFGRAVNTGNVNSKGYGVGAYFTRYTADSSYIDTVAQYTHYHNDYRSIYSDTASQSGDGMTLSVEIGKPFKHTSGWFIEPQAQVIYQYLHLGDINDGVAGVSATNDSSGIARLGARIGYDSVATSNVHPYITADLLNVIGRSPDVSVSNTTFDQNYSSQWGEVGGGFTGDLTKNTTLYADIKYKKGLDEDMHGFSGNLGVRVNW
ncbi:autotransporter outer membrane beta-barrel domain-containing protein [Budvicia diplopodorum]|uniref:autotransporter outer membrane beta-barrel domain-containing protein n=1 Tax=Budvicia diplopodorum TaxID=1119056 RepID=UPI001357A41A|nr:autotransporter outer membrane beta-barrel domain-containing protein [Budvicia diplopodorum]